MEKEEFLKLLRKYRTGTASEQEKSFLMAYYNLCESEVDITEMLSADEKEFLKNRIKADLKKQIELHRQKPLVKTYPIFSRIAAAAVIFIALSVGIYLYTHNGNLVNRFRYANNNIAPGGNRAILTLANGKQIVLSNAHNGQLARQGSTQINKTANGQIIYNASGAVSSGAITYNTLSTPRGGQYLVVLPDSSKVYLDAASSLKFPTTFSGNTRTVTLTGEAYFEVAHNKSKPFRVITKQQTVEVLGTHFNINAYDDERSIKTTLLAGSVRISAAAQTATLMPGEQAEITAPVTPDKNLAIKVNRIANTDEVIAWKNGFFQFDNADIETIMRQFARWYDVDVIYQGKVNKRLFSGEIHRNLSLLQALDLLNYANVNFHTDGKKIIVSP